MTAVRTGPPGGPVAGLLVGGSIWRIPDWGPAARPGFPRRQPVDHRVVHLGLHSDPAAVHTGRRVVFPEWAGAIQRRATMWATCSQAGGLLA
jgi:hypothetical protein